MSAERALWSSRVRVRCCFSPFDPTSGRSLTTCSSDSYHSPTFHIHAMSYSEYRVYLPRWPTSFSRARDNSVTASGSLRSSMVPLSIISFSIGYYFDLFMVQPSWRRESVREAFLSAPSFSLPMSLFPHFRLIPSLISHIFLLHVDKTLGSADCGHQLHVTPARPLLRPSSAVIHNF